MNDGTLLEGQIVITIRGPWPSIHSQDLVSMEEPMVFDDSRPPVRSARRHPDEVSAQPSICQGSSISLLQIRATRTGW